MTPAQEALALARERIKNPAHFSQKAYIRDKESMVRQLRAVGHRGVSDLKHWCKLARPDITDPHVHSMCMVSAVVASAPDEYVAAEALVILGQHIASEAVDAAIPFKSCPHEYEQFNNQNPDGHKGVLNLLAVASGKSELFIL